MLIAGLLVTGCAHNAVETERDLGDVDILVSAGKCDRWKAGIENGIDKFIKGKFHVNQVSDYDNKKPKDGLTYRSDEMDIDEENWNLLVEKVQEVCESAVGIAVLPETRVVKNGLCLFTSKQNYYNTKNRSEITWDTFINNNVSYFEEKCKKSDILKCIKWGDENV